MGQVALLDVLDRDGQPRQSFAVHEWPLRVGRALDNDLVLSDPHIAAHHLTIAATEHGFALTLADTRNGAWLGRKRLRGGESAALELPIVPRGSPTRRALPIGLAALALIVGTLFGTWLDTDPEGLTRAIGNALFTGLIGAAIWCTAWALMSKTFTRQAHFGWHVRVFLFASLALLVVGALPALLAFAFSWPWLSDFDFIGTIAVVATALYFHLLAVEPARHRQLRWVAATCAFVGVALSMWFNMQRSDQLGEELYMNHLFPPALRIAKPISSDAFVDDLATLKATLDKKAREPARGDEGSRVDNE